MTAAVLSAPRAAAAGPGLSPSARIAAAALAWTAAAIHLVLTPEHFRERTVYGLFFLGASLFQVWLAWALVRRPGPLVYRVGALGSLGLIATWLVTRAAAPPLSETGGPEPVTLPGVVATGAELATLLVLATALPVPPGKRRRARWVLGACVGLGFGLLLLFATSSFSYVPWVARDLPYFNNVYGGLSLWTPFIIGMPVPHLWVVGAWSTFALIGVAAVLVAANVGVAVGRRGDACASRHRSLLAVAPAFLAVSSCCGAPAALFLGASAVAPLGRVTPWLLVATIVMLLGNLGLLVRGCGSGAGKRP